MKKVFSLMIAFVLALSVLVLPTSAADTDRSDPKGYYIIGTMNDWQIREDYRITSYDSATYRFPLFMTPDDSFKIVYSSDGVDPDQGRYYPEGERNAFNQESRIIKEPGTYVFAFRPACDGGKGYADDGMIYLASKKEIWYYDCIICEGYQSASYAYLHGDEPATEPGYYIVGNMTDGKLKKTYRIIKRYGSHYESEYPITLRRGDTFKIAYSEDGEHITHLYPEGEGNAYNEDKTRIFYDGQEMEVFFFPNADARDNAYASFEEDPHFNMIAVCDTSMWDCLTPVEIPAKPHTGGVYRKALKAAYPDIDEAYLDYEELYIHRDKNGEADWVCVWASNYEYDSGYYEYGEGYFYTVIGNRLFYQYGYRGHPFLTHFGVYDVRQNRFYDPALCGRDGFKAENYADFDRVINEYASVKYNSIGRLLGDLDRDDEISVIDATMIQRCEAQISDWPKNDAFSLYDFITVYSPVRTYYYSDFNCDGDRDILDVTFIQRYLLR